jgi:hypothetical protein
MCLWRGSESRRPGSTLAKLPGRRAWPSSFQRASCESSVATGPQVNKATPGVFLNTHLLESLSSPFFIPNGTAGEPLAGVAVRVMTAPDLDAKKRQPASQTQEKAKPSFSTVAYRYACTSRRAKD